MELNIASYNSTGLGVGQMDYINSILDSNQIDILLLQEIWLLQNDIIPKLSKIHDNYYCSGVSGIDQDVLLHGRPYGGMAVMWRKDLTKSYQTFTTESRRICGINFKLSNGLSLLVLCIYMPVDNRSQTVVDYEFDQCVGEVDTLIEKYQCDFVVVGGDLNIDLQRNNAHVECFKDCAIRNELVFTWQYADDPGTATFSSATMTSAGSQIDHILVSKKLSDCIKSVGVCEIPSDHGHRPVLLCLKMQQFTRFSIKHPSVNNKQEKIAWHKVTYEHYDQYRLRVKQLVKDNGLLECFSQCQDMGCGKHDHFDIIDLMCNAITDICYQAGFDSFPKCKKAPKLAPFWNENIKPFRDDSLFWGKIWKDCGRPSTGVVYELYKKSRRLYHYAVRNHKNKLKDLRNSRIAESMSKNKHRDLWKELRKLKAYHNVTPVSVDGMENEHDICNLFATKYEHLYNSVPSDIQVLDQLIQNINTVSSHCDYQDFTITAQEITKAVKLLNCEKHDGDKGVWSDFIIQAPKEIHCALAKLFTMMFTHGYYPYQLLLATIVSIPKDNSQGYTCNNFRGIVLSSCINKLFDLIVIGKYHNHLRTSDLQFAYKKCHSTTLCTLTLKEVVQYYNSNGATVYCSLLDASKAFDRIQIDKMIQLLLEKQLPAPVIRILLDSFLGQRVRTSWQNAFSKEFSCINGLRQGGVASPILFTIYFDELLRRLETSGSGCFVGHEFMGAFAYADDVTLAAPTLRGLQRMLNTCEQFASEFNVMFNEKKTQNIAFNSRGTIPGNKVCLNGEPINWSTEVKHLGNILTCQMKDEADIKHKRNDFIRRINSLVINFASVQRRVCNKLFDSNCFFYGSQHWVLNNQRAIELFHVQWRKSVRRLWNLPWITRSSILPHLVNKPPFIDQLCDRFVSLCKAIDNCDNEKIKLIKLVSVHNSGIMKRNIDFVCERRGCTPDSLKIFRKQTSCENSRRAEIIKELTECIEQSKTINIFSQFEIKDFLYAVCTF